MNISTVAANLRQMIAGKQAQLERLRKLIADLDALDDQGDSWFRATVVVEFLTINIDDLKKILADIEACATEQSWRDNPDRSGGQFTEDEIDRAGEWR